MNDASGGRFRILLVEDSLEEAFLVRALVESEGLGEVVVAQDGVQGIELVRQGVYDLMICDLNLPGRDGVAVVDASKREYPERPIIVTTGYSDAEVHTRVLESGADRVLTKPLDRDDFLEALWSLLASGGGRSGEPTRTILAVGAFPGDVELGCGGILAGHARQGCQVVILALSPDGPDGRVPGYLVEEAARRLGGHHRYGDAAPGDRNRMVELVREAARVYQPDTVLAPSARDRSGPRKDALAAALDGAPDAPHVYSYQTLSSTLEFRPNLFAGVEKVLERKLRALECYAGFGCESLDPALVRATALYWSRFSRHSAVEPLERVRSPSAAAAPAPPAAVPVAGVGCPSTPAAGPTESREDGTPGSGPARETEAA